MPELLSHLSAQLALLIASYTQLRFLRVVFVNNCLLDVDDVSGWMTIHAFSSSLRLFQSMTPETAMSPLMSNLVHVVSRFVWCLIICLCIVTFYAYVLLNSIFYAHSNLFQFYFGF